MQLPCVGVAHLLHMSLLSPLYQVPEVLNTRANLAECRSLVLIFIVGCEHIILLSLPPFIYKYIPSEYF